MTITVCTTLAPYIMEQEERWSAWLMTAEELRESHDVRFFAAIETDARGLEPFKPLVDRLHVVGGTYWTFGFDDGNDEITTANRLQRITMGQNIANSFSAQAWASHMLFMAADCMPPGDALAKLLELDHPIVGGEVPTYCLSGPLVRSYAARGIPVQEHMATAAFVLLAREVFTQVPWRWDMDKGMSDDPCLHHDVQKYLGYPTYVRKDCYGIHYPECIGAMEERYSKDARTVRR